MVMADLPKRLTGDQAAIGEFVDKFDVSRSTLEVGVSLISRSDLPI